MKQAKCIILGLALCCEAISLGATTTPFTFTFSVSNNAPQSVSQPNTLCVSEFNLPSTINTPVQINVSSATRMSCPTTISNHSICTVDTYQLADSSVDQGQIGVNLELQAAVPTKKSYTYHTQQLCSQVNNLLVIDPNGSSLSSSKQGTLNVDSAVVDYFKAGTVAGGRKQFNNNDWYSDGPNNFMPTQNFTATWAPASNVGDVCKQFNTFLSSDVTSEHAMEFVLAYEYSQSTYALSNPTSPANQMNIGMLAAAMGCIPDQVQLSCSSRNPIMKTNLTSSSMPGISTECYTGTTTQATSQSYGLTGLGYVDSIDALVGSVGGNFTASNVCQNIFTQPSASSTGWFSGSTPESIVQGLQGNCSFNGTINRQTSLQDIIGQIGFNGTLNQTVNCTITSSLGLSC